MQNPDGPWPEELDVKLLLSFTQIPFSAHISSQRKYSGMKSLRAMAYPESI